jgi:D-sedoheptulose 7-phosphate isomerase
MANISDTSGATPDVTGGQPTGAAASGDLSELAAATSAPAPAQDRQDVEARIAADLQAHLASTQQLQQQAPLLAEVADHLIAAFRAGKKVLLCGNGGSAADAQHLAAEFVGKFYFDRPALPAEALTVNTSSLTAIGNDYSFDVVFSRQVEAFGAAGDVLIGITTSGNSRNVLEAFRVARQKGILTVGLTGASGGQLKEAADYCICIASTDTPRIQEQHILVGHILCELVEQALFGEAVSAARAERLLAVQS